MSEVRFRLTAAGNSAQGSFRRVLCVCSVGMLRSPTVAEVLSREPFGYNTRSAGIDEDYALVVVDKPLLNWAQEIVVMEPDHRRQVENLLADYMLNPVPVLCLDIPDDFDFREPRLVSMVPKRYRRAVHEHATRLSRGEAVA